MSDRQHKAKTVDPQDPWEYGPWGKMDRPLGKIKHVREVMTDRLEVKSNPARHVVDFLFFTEENDRKTLAQIEKQASGYLKGHGAKIVEVRKTPGRWFRLGRPDMIIRAEFRIKLDPKWLPKLGSNPRTAKARYKEKKKVKNKDGEESTVYVYGPRQVANRNKKKAERIEKLRKSIGKLRKKVMSDLDNPAALAIALMDATYERVGNESSAKEGHVGVTGWKPEHVKFKGNKAVISYVGKSGVEQKKEITDAKLVKALKNACDDDDCEYVVGVGAKEVNEYLKPFDITAKDIRGFHANREMQDRLKEVRKKGPSLPKERKEKDKILKEEFKKALEETAKAVGHEPSTLKNQYLVPGMEDSYLHDGSVSDELHKKASVLSPLEEDSMFGKSYLGDVSRDTFIHFTPKSRAEQIVKAGRLLMKPPYDKFGTDTVDAVSLTYGSYVPGVQVTHTKTTPGDPMVAVVFKTAVKPTVGYSEEVKWNRDVPFRGRAKIVPLNRAVSMLRSTPEKISGDDMVRYAGRKEKEKSEKEDEQAEKMVRKAPKKKPPRQDLRNNQPLEDRDKDLEGMDRQDGGDDDLQKDVRRMAGRIASRWLVLKVAMQRLAQDAAKKPGDVWFSEDNNVWVGMNPNKAVQAFPDKDRAQAFAKGEQAPAKEKEPSKEEEEPDDQEEAPTEEEKQKEREESEAEARIRAEKAVNQATSVVRDLLGDNSALDESIRDSLQDALGGLSDKQREDFAKSFQERLSNLTQEDASSSQMQEMAVRAMEFEGYDGLRNPDQLAKRVAEAAFARNVVANPLILGGQKVTGEAMDAETLEARSSQALEHYRTLNSDLRNSAADKIESELNKIDPKSNRAKELKAILQGIAVAEIAETGKSPGKSMPQPSEGMAALVRKMVEQGSGNLMFKPAEDFFNSDSQAQVVKAMRKMSPKEVVDLMGGNERDSPYNELAESLLEDEVPFPFDEGIKDYLIEQHVQDITWNDRLVRDVMKANNVEGADDPEKRAETIRDARRDAKAELYKQYQECVKSISKAKAAGKTPDQENVDCAMAFQEAEDALLQAENTRELLETLEAQGMDLPDSPAVAVLRTFAETGDPKMLKTTTKPSPESFSGSAQRQKSSSWPRFSSYMDTLIRVGPCPNTTFTPSGRRAFMPKITKKGAQQVTADLDRLADLFQHNHNALRLPEHVATDLARRLDTVSSHLELVTGLDKEAAGMDPKHNFTEEKIEGNEFDPADIGAEEASVLERQPDEPYMDTFSQDEFDQLREVQQTGQFSNAKAAMTLLAKLANRIAADDKKEDDKKAESHEDKDDKDAGKKASKKSEDHEEDKKAEKDEDKDAGKKASHGYDLFA